MKLMTNELRKKLPPLHSTKDQEDPMVICRFYYPRYGVSFYAIEFDGENMFYGLIGHDKLRFDYFSLGGLEETQIVSTLTAVERMPFKPCRLSAFNSQIAPIMVW